MPRHGFGPVKNVNCWDMLAPSLIARSSVHTEMRGSRAMTRRCFDLAEAWCCFPD